jgi:hypothetical protein
MGRLRAFGEVLWVGYSPSFECQHCNWKAIAHGGTAERNSVVATAKWHVVQNPTHHVLRTDRTVTEYYLKEDGPE